jgi:peptide-methionine (S)-S-oxide reductase
MCCYISKLFSMKFIYLFICMLFVGSLAFGQANPQIKKNMSALPTTALAIPEGFEVATLGSGCFWCIEAIYQDLKGVEQVKSGYSGGHIEKPTYKQVTSGTTGHAEVIQFFYNPQVISFTEILEIFWSSHDPTTLNRQGADVGPQYRSAVFYHNEVQREAATFYKDKLDASKAYNKPIVTEITPFQNFYVAEDYHQNYFKENGMQPYCQFVIRPKVEKFRQVFSEKLR